MPDTGMYVPVASNGKIREMKSVRQQKRKMLGGGCGAGAKACSSPGPITALMEVSSAAPPRFSESD